MINRNGVHLPDTTYDGDPIDWNCSSDSDDNLQRLKAENAKLRELVRRYSEYTDQDRCEGCVYKSRCNDGYVDECWQLTEIRGLARELGIEVPE